MLSPPLLASSSSSLWRFSAALDGRPAIAGEFEVHPGGSLTIVPLRRQQSSLTDSEDVFGRGVGTWRQRPSGVVEAEVQLYAYTLQDQPEEPVEMRLICQTVESTWRGCVFEGEVPTMIGALPRALPCGAAYPRRCAPLRGRRRFRGADTDGGSHGTSLRHCAGRAAAGFPPHTPQICARAASRGVRFASAAPGPFRT